MLRQRQLPDEYEFELFVEGRRILLSEQAAKTEDDDEELSRIESYAPHALILSSGNITPFSLTMIRLSDEATRQVRVMPNGEVRIGSEDADFE